MGDPDAADAAPEPDRPGRRPADPPAPDAPPASRTSPGCSSAWPTSPAGPGPTRSGSSAPTCPGASRPATTGRDSGGRSRRRSQARRSGTDAGAACSPDPMLDRPDPPRPATDDGPRRRRAHDRAILDPLLLAGDLPRCVGCATLGRPGPAAGPDRATRRRTGPFAVFTELPARADAAGDPAACTALETDIEDDASGSGSSAEEPPVEVYILNDRQSFTHFLKFYYPELPPRRAFFLAQGTAAGRLHVHRRPPRGRPPPRGHPRPAPRGGRRPAALARRGPGRILRGPDGRSG